MPSDKEPKDKKKGKVVHLFEKVLCLDKVDREVSTAAFGHHGDENDTTSCFFKGSEDKIKRSVNGSAQAVAKICVSSCDSLLEKFEGVLCAAGRWNRRMSWHSTRMCIRTWRRRQSKRRLPLSSPSLLSLSWLFTLFLSITLTASSQEHRRRSNKHQHKGFRVY